MRGNALRALVPALVVLALVGVVAIAATGSTPSGTDDARPPAPALLDTLVSLMLLLLVPAAAIFVYGLMQRKEISREMALRGRRSRFIAFVVFMFVFTTIAYFGLRDWERTPIEDAIVDVVVEGESTTPTPPPGTSEVPYEPEFAWGPVLVVVTLVVIGATAAYLAARRRKGGLRDEEVVAGVLADALDDTLDDLRAEADPRRAVIASYARFERILAAHGMVRRAAETPEEYLARILPALEVDRRSTRRLTDLYTRAKFSHHDVDAGMKEEAIGALSTVRDELRAAAARRDEERAEKASVVVEGRV